MSTTDSAVKVLPPSCHGDTRSLSEASGDRSRLVTPSISVIIPTYNCAEYIDGALHSVAMQAYPKVEIIVIDDGSNDRTRDVVTRSGVPCRFETNQRSKGPAGARNHGIQLSRGEYIAFLDADDVWLSDKLTLQMAAFDVDPQLVALGGTMIPWDSVQTIAPATPEVREYSFEEMIVHNRLCTPTVICRREVLSEAGLFDEGLSISEDYELWLRLSRIGRVARIETPLARYRQRLDGASAGNRDRTYALDVQLVRSLSNRYPEVSGIHRLISKGLSARALDRAIELCDVERRYRDAFQSTIVSLWNWPWTNPMGGCQSFVRLRRIRRILLDAMSHSLHRAEELNA